MSTTRTRRTVLANAAAGADLAVPAVAAGAVADTDPHPGWHAEIERLEAQYRGNEELYDANCHEIFRLETLIGQTPARTAAGVRVQLEMVLSCHRAGSILGPVEETAIENAIASVEGLAAQA